MPPVGQNLTFGNNELKCFSILIPPDSSAGKNFNVSQSKSIACKTSFILETPGINGILD